MSRWLIKSTIDDAYLSSINDNYEWTHDEKQALAVDDGTKNRLLLMFNDIRPQYEAIPTSWARLVEKSSIPAESNPFMNDPTNMGHEVGQNLMMMYGNHSNQECKYLIFVNTKTGERVKLEFEV